MPQILILELPLPNPAGGKPGGLEEKVGVHEEVHEAVHQRAEAVGRGSSGTLSRVWVSVLPSLRPEVIIGGL